MAKTTLYTWQKLLADNNMQESELPEKITNRIKKFNTETDEDKKEALDEKIFSDIDDIIEQKAADAKKAEKDKKRLAAQQQDDDFPTKVPAPKKKTGAEESSFIDRTLFGRK